MMIYEEWIGIAFHDMDVPYFRYYHGISLEGLRKPQNKLMI
jgi:hypothetical protein